MIEQRFSEISVNSNQADKKPSEFSVIRVMKKRVN